MPDEKEFIEITFPYNSDVYSIEKNSTLLFLSKKFQHLHDTPIVAAKVNNDIRELYSHIDSNCKIEFIDFRNIDGMRIYKRSLCFMLIKAVHDLFPNRNVIISHSISKGIYCEIIGDTSLTKEETSMLEARMHKLVELKIPFEKKTIPINKAKKLFEKVKRLDRYKMIEYRKKPYVTIYECGDIIDYFYGYMVPDTGYLQKFKLKFYQPGLIIRSPEFKSPLKVPPFKEQKKLFSVFKEFKRWGNILGIDNIGQLNDIVNRGQIDTLIRVSEALHEKKLAQIADMVVQSTPEKKLILIAGPSSSGKTTFAQRLSIQLRVNGLSPVTISLDNYFVDREHTPIDENGNPNFEDINAIDLELFNNQLLHIIAGEEVEIPSFSFARGMRKISGKKMKLSQNSIIIVEGIHGLNEDLTALIPKPDKFKIYVSALTSTNIDDHNIIPTTDTRLIRRIVRDFQFRGCSALNTIKLWSSVRHGEEKNIFPFQGEANVMFNSFLMFELGVLKLKAEPLLMQISNNHPEYSEAKRLLEFLAYFLPIPPENIPFNSILREFIGESCFY